MSSAFQQTLNKSLVVMLKPLVKLMLLCGLGCAEFISIAKAVFVQVATEEYGIRGRPTNVSRVAAMTGLSRKEVSKIRAEPATARWTPDMEANPANTIIHYWQYDPDYCESPGVARVLPFEGTKSFSTLVNKYAGDIPPGALRKELCRTDTIAEQADRSLRVMRRYFYPRNFHEDFIRNIAFSIRNLGSTIVHNAELVQRDGGSEEVHFKYGRFERYAWSERLSDDSVEQFRKWVRQEGAQFIDRADRWIGANELPASEWAEVIPRSVGVGLYFFEED